jgi:thiamine phosphate synthase YjbQ (UPF0047 family)
MREDIKKAMEDLVPSTTKAQHTTTKGSKKADK